MKAQHAGAAGDPEDPDRILSSSPANIERSGSRGAVGPKREDPAGANPETVAARRKGAVDIRHAGVETKPHAGEQAADELTLRLSRSRPEAMSAARTSLPLPSTYSPMPFTFISSSTSFFTIVR